VVKTGKSRPEMVAVLRELERELGSKVLKFRSTREGGAEVFEDGVGRPF
jgi:hypothetical protein